MDDRDQDKKVKLYKENSSTQMISIDQIKSLYIASGLSEEQIVEKVPFLSVDRVRRIVEEHKLPELRKAYIREGISKIQNDQLGQAQKLLDLELNFKKLRIIQLEKKLEDFLAYYTRHGDFCKRHPVTGDILKDTDGIPMQLSVPSVSKEIFQLKESVTLSEGLKKLLLQIDDIINGRPKGEEADKNGDIIDMEEVDQYFKKRV